MGFAGLSYEKLRFWVDEGLSDIEIALAMGTTPRVVEYLAHDLRKGR